jgi:hypothetical protein
LAGADDARPALNGGFGRRNVLALDRIDPKGEKAGKRLASGTDANVALHEGHKTRKVKNGIAGKVVRLETIEVEELAKEIRSRKAEATLKVSKKNNDLTGFEHRLDLVAWKPADDSFRNPPRPVEPVDLELGHVGTSPGSACLVLSGGPARCAGLLFPAGCQIHPVGSAAILGARGGSRERPFARHGNLGDAEIYRETVFTKQTLARRSTRKKKSKTKNG